MPRPPLVALLVLTACAEPNRPRSTPTRPSVPTPELAPPGAAAGAPTVSVSGLAAPGCPAVPRPTGSPGLDTTLTRNAQTLLYCCDAAGVGNTPGAATWTLSVAAGQATEVRPTTGEAQYDPRLVECHRRKIARWDLSAVDDGTYVVTFDPT